MGKVSALNFQSVSISYIGWISNGNISTRMSRIQNMSIVVVIVDCRQLFFKSCHIVATVFKPFSFLLSLYKVRLNYWQSAIQLPASHVTD